MRISAPPYLSSTRPSARRLCNALLISLVLPAMYCLAGPASAQGSAVMISGSIFDRGRPAQGVAVHLAPVMDDYEGHRLRLGLGELWAHPVAVSETDGDGRYGFEVPAGTRWRLIVEARDRATVTRRLEPLYADREMEPVVLRPAVTVEVRVRSSGGRPVPGARLTAYSSGYTYDQWPYSWTAGSTDLTGRARLRVPKQQPWHFEVVGPNLPPVDVEHVGIGQSGGRVVDVRLPEPSRLDLDLRLPSGQPAADAMVFRPGKGITLARSDSDGRASIFGAPGSQLEIQVLTNDGHAFETTVRFSAPAHGEAGSAEAVAPAARWELLPPRRLDVEVTTAGGVEPVAGAVAWARDDRLVYGDGRGRVLVTIPATERSIKLSLAAPGHLPWMAPRISLSSTEQVLTVGLEPAAVLRGRVVDAAGRPVEGAALHASPESDSASRARFRNFPEGWDGRTGPDGRFTLSPVPAAARLGLVARKPGYAEGRLIIDPLLRHEERAGIELVLAVGRRAVGLVTDEASRPVADAVVELFPRNENEESDRDALPGVTVTTGADGRFALHSLGAKPFDLRVSASGYVSATVPGLQIPGLQVPGLQVPGPQSGESLPGGEPSDLGTFRLEPAVSLAGRVVDESGSPLPGITVELTRPGARTYGTGEVLRGRSDADGHFLFVDRAPGSYELQADEEGYLLAQSGRLETPLDEPVVLVLRRGVTLRGRVVDDSGAAVAGATVTATHRAAGNRRIRATSDEGGAFELAGLAAGEHRFYVKVDGYTSESRKVQIVSGRDPEPSEVVLRRTSVVAGQVSWPDGRPVSDVSVRAKPAGDDDARGSWGATNDQGRFEIGEVFPGPTVIVATLGSFEVRQDLEVRPGRNLVSLTLPAGFIVSGWITGDQGEAVTAAEVKLWPDDGFEPAWSGDDGAFELRDVAPAEYRIRVRHPDYVEFEANETFHLGAESISGLEVRLTRGAVVSGSVQGLEPDILADVRVKLFRTAGEGRAGSHSAAPDHRGRFRMEHVGPGTYLAEAQHNDDTLAVGRFELPEGVTEVEVDLLPVDGVEVRGRVVRGGESLADVYVGLNTQDRRSINSHTAGDGTFVLHRVPEGEYVLIVNEPDGHHKIDVQVIEGVDLLVELPAGEVSGLVRSAATGEPVARARIDLQILEVSDLASDGWRNRSFRTLRSDSQGVFVARSLPAGLLRLRVEHDDHGVGLADVDVGSQPTRGVEIALSPVEDVVLHLRWDDGTPVQAEAALVAVFDAAGHPELTTSEGVDEGGRVQIDGLPAGDWRIWLFTESSPWDENVPESSAWQEVAFRVPTDGEIPVVLTQGATLALTVPELAVPGEFPETTASLVDADGRTLPEAPDGGGAFVLIEGSVHVTGLWPGVWTLKLHHPDGRSWSTTFVTEAGATTEVVLE